MVSSLASLLFLGIVPTVAAVTAPPRVLPGIEVVDIAPSSDVRDHFQMPVLSSSSALLIDLDSGEEIASIDADTPRPMASLTKIMTALLILEDGRLSRIATVPPITESIGGSSIELKTGEQLSVQSLLQSLLIQSANDSAYTLAATAEGSVGKFVKRMNERATVLGLTSTTFANPAGLDHPEQLSTARDLSFLTKAALRHDAFRRITDTRSSVISTYGGRSIGLRNTNEMLHFNPDVHGVKTGTTNGAGECLIIVFEEGSRSYMLVLLKSNDRYNDALRVLDAVKNAEANV
ncbi:MAG: D-alanyl-D-alanine carboxypeptidase family protein [Candidatus Peribacteraceae bacterium]